MKKNAKEDRLRAQLKKAKVLIAEQQARIESLQGLVRHSNAPTAAYYGLYPWEGNWSR